MILRLSNTEAFEQLLTALQQADVVVQDTRGDIAALSLKGEQVVFVIERFEGANDPDPWRGYCHLPSALFKSLARVISDDILAILDKIQYFVANAAEIDSTFDEVLFGNYVEYISREDAAAKLGFEWWK